MVLAFADWELPDDDGVSIAGAVATLPEIAEFVPIVVNMLEQPAPELVSKELKREERVKIISRVGTGVLLNLLGDISSAPPFASFNPTDAILTMAVGSANVSHIDTDPELCRRYAGLIEPDYMRRGISRAAISRATGLPLETVRRRINGLIENKVLTERADGIVLSANNPFKIGARLDHMHAHAQIVERMMRELKARGVTFS